tara:strand:+ start:430 stop:744 length:315 start_codon:yes stop_codon:yes gene_type:complete
MPLNKVQEFSFIPEKGAFFHIKTTPYGSDKQVELKFGKTADGQFVSEGGKKVFVDVVVYEQIEGKPQAKLTVREEGGDKLYVAVSWPPRSKQSSRDFDDQAPQW